LSYSSTLKMFLRNVGWLSTDYTALYPRRHNYLLLYFPSTWILPRLNKLLCFILNSSIVIEILFSSKDP
jgi:hypothetical protein